MGGGGEVVGVFLRSIFVGSVYCWGDNTYGQLGNGTQDTTVAPVLVSGATRHATGGERTQLSIYYFFWDGEFHPLNLCVNDVVLSGMSPKYEKCNCQSNHEQLDTEAPILREERAVLTGWFLLLSDRCRSVKPMFNFFYQRHFFTTERNLFSFAPSCASRLVVLGVHRNLQSPIFSVAAVYTSSPLHET